MNSGLKDKIASAPDMAGVYLMKDLSGKIIYIGKARSLKKRLNSYIKGGLTGKNQALVLNVKDIEYKICQNESMALILEASLVRKYKPKYNVALRDDKSFPMVKITNEAFASVYITRKKEKDGARYFGPYTNAGLLKEAMKIIRRHFPYRGFKQMPQEDYLDQCIGLSPAKEMEKKEYARRIKNISLILQGKTDILIKGLSKDMHKKSRKMDFEGAARMRDQIIALGVMRQGQANFNNESGLKELKNLMKLKKIPRRIEAFDVSNIFGREACGSMVSFYGERADKNNYRKFRIKTIEGINDYRMLGEIVRRRYSRVVRDNLALPDLVIIDGGKGHLSVAEKELKALGLNIPLISIAKKEENLYIIGRKRPVKLNQYPLGLNLIRRVRDEAHRFAVSYHRLLRRKRAIGI